MARYILVLSLGTIFGLISMQPVNAQTTYPVPYQSIAYPLKTQIYPAQIAEFNSLFELGKFDPKKAIALRTQLQPLCDTNDSVACYWLAKTYDWYEFGIGQDLDIPIAMKWYRKAADLNYTNAAYFLYQAYFYEYMGLKKNDLEATKWLNIEIYRLICLKKITPEQATPIYTLEEYQALFLNHSDDRCNFNFQG